MELLGFIIIAGLSFGAGYWFADYRRTKKDKDEHNGMY